MNRVPLLDMKAQLAPMRKEIDEAIAKVLDHGGFILGREVGEFENAVSAYSGAKYAVGVSNGTDAITLALLAMGIGPGDRVICPSFTYYATAGAVVHAGAEPVFVDIDPETCCISVEAVDAYFKRTTDDGRRVTKAIIPVHLYGQCADMDAVLKVSKQYGLKAIEDTAQAFGASYKGKKAGIFSDAGTVSFFPGKNLGACGDAGAVLTGDEELADKMRRLSNQGADPENRYVHIYAGRNNRLDTIQAAVLKVKLKYLDAWNKKRAENAAYYNKKFEGTGLITPFVPPENVHIYHQYVLKAKDTAQRERILDQLKEKDVDARVFYAIPLHLQPCFKYLGYKKGDMPESEKAAGQVFAIPVYPELTKEQLDYVADTIKGCL